MWASAVFSKNRSSIEHKDSTATAMKRVWSQISKSQSSVRTRNKSRHCCAGGFVPNVAQSCTHGNGSNGQTHMTREQVSLLKPSDTADALMVMCLEQTVGENQQTLMLLPTLCTVLTFCQKVARETAHRSLAMASAVSQNVVRQRVSGLRDSAASCSDFARNCGDEA